MTETAIRDDIEQKTRVNSNLYKVPIELISFCSCSEGRPLQGSTMVKWIIEAKSPQAAILKLVEVPAYWKNWNSYSPEARKSLNYQPFRINLENKIEEIPACSERHKTEKGDYVCGVPCTEEEPDIHGINGEFGDCMCQSLWTYSPDELKESCPYKQILQARY
jgi:hypothetical protein